MQLRMCYVFPPGPMWPTQRPGGLPLLRTWNVDLATRFNLASTTFAGGKLFGDQALQDVQVETPEREGVCLLAVRKMTGSIGFDFLEVPLFFPQPL